MKGFESIDAAQRDYSPERLNANCVKAALHYVYFVQGQGASVAEALRLCRANGPCLTEPEYACLYRALGVSR